MPHLSFHEEDIQTVLLVRNFVQGLSDKHLKREVAVNPHKDQGSDWRTLYFSKKLLSLHVLGH